jgi:hypothetical protein
MSVADFFSLANKLVTKSSIPGPVGVHGVVASCNVTGTGITSGTYEIYRLFHFSDSDDFKWYVIVIKNFSTNTNNTVTNNILFPEPFDNTLKVRYVITGSILTDQGTHGFFIQSATNTNYTQFTNDAMIFMIYGL